MKNLWQLHPQLADDTHPLATFALCELRLMDDANYPWLVLVPRVAEAVELIDLDAAQRHALTDEIDRASRLLRGFGLQPRTAPEDAFDLGVPFQARINQD